MVSSKIAKHYVQNGREVELDADGNPAYRDVLRLWRSRMSQDAMMDLLLHACLRCLMQLPVFQRPDVCVGSHVSVLATTF